MPPAETLLPRPALFNAALYAVSALIYTVTLFALETIQPGKYLFDPVSSWRDRFSYVAIVSWPILFFGSLILFAVRIGAQTRKRKPKKSKRKQSKDVKRSRNLEQEVKRSRDLQHTTDGEEAQIPATRQRSKKKSSVRRKVPRGYVSVTRAQRVFAAFGFLWVAIGLAFTAAAGVLVFFGQRERFEYLAEQGGSREDAWKTWVIPLVTGGVPLLVYGVMALTTAAKFYATMTAKESTLSTPATSEGAEEEEAVPEFGVEVLFEEPVRAEGLGEDSYGFRPDQRTVESMLRHLREMGFRNEQQNLAALQASSFDLEVASGKLANAQI